ncbi:hypothetical protein GE253_23545 [Niveispirillum sp. SYP-B3756]|uniref:nuclear transport factor 2 family protein n=1 Tax=Niveispirillum sp. SYP-B3756 TaxID=2662178 RepID=UPI00129245D5|nr:nuclear transport factor 2 family protein [Niveispirillum sp. SYP-B3756]MQP68298.1 hypothetical protein [Niveispirillum sp. SYP-B3756]
MITHPSPLTHLLSIEAIKCVKARYFRAMDTKDWPLLADVFTHDARCDYREAFQSPGATTPAGTDDDILNGRDMIIAYIRKGLLPLISVHHGHMPEIEILADGTATAIWPMNDLLRFHAGPYREMRGYGHYHETYRQEDGRWRIATLKLTRLLIEMTPA